MGPRATVTVVAMAIGLAMVGAACGSAESGDVSAEATSTATPTATPSPTATVETIGSGDFDASAPELTVEWESVPEGPYAIETLGIPLSLTVSGDWIVPENRATETVLADPDSFQPGDRDVVFVRPSALAHPSTLNAPLAEQEPWPVGDLEGWLENLDAGIVTTETQEVVLGGRDAKVFDVSLAPDFPCGPEFCAGFVGSRVAGKVFSPNYNYRVWWVDGGEYEPVAIVAGSGPEGSDFFSRAEGLLSTIAFGTPGPHPVPPEADLWECGFDSMVPAGTIDLPQAGGVRLDFPGERFVMPRGELALIEVGEDLWVDFMIVEESADGQSIETVDDVVAALAAASMDVTETSGGTILGQPARVFDIAAQPGAASKLTLIPEWFNPNLGRVWLAETDRGVFLYAGETAGTNTQVDAVIAEAEAMLPSLEFIDPPCPDPS
jgi:hypothetical protein